METSPKRKVLVTGGSRGIGLGLARAFLDDGAEVAICGRDGESLERARTDLAPLGKVHDIVADIGSQGGCNALAQDAVAAMGRIDVLCANAGVFPLTSIEDVTETEFDEVVGTNLKGLVFGVQACLDSLAQSGTGRVVVTSSITGAVVGYPGLSQYAMTKAGQLGFIRSAALELASTGTTINAVVSGTIRTEAMDSISARSREHINAAIPYGSVGEVDDIARVAVFLADERAGFITGQSIVVDGGQTLPELPWAQLGRRYGSTE